MSTSRHDDCYRDEDPAQGLIGDDLTDEDLDELWCLLTGSEDVNLDSEIVKWYQDKPHQVVYRLLLRLTRAEHTVGSRDNDAEESP